MESLTLYYTLNYNWSIYIFSEAYKNDSEFNHIYDWDKSLLMWEDIFLHKDFPISNLNERHIKQALASLLQTKITHNLKKGYT